MTKDALFDGFDEIICVIFQDGKGLFGQAALDRMEQEPYQQLMSRSEFKMLTYFDMGDKWGKWGKEMPTLFKLKKETPLSIRNRKFE